MVNVHEAADAKEYLEEAVDFTDRLLVLAKKVKTFPIRPGDDVWEWVIKYIEFHERGEVAERQTLRF